MSHVYLSTACLHGGHDLCRRICKYCPAPCTCDCHDAEPTRRVQLDDRRGVQIGNGNVQTNHF